MVEESGVMIQLDVKERTMETWRFRLHVSTLRPYV